MALSNPRFSHRRIVCLQTWKRFASCWRDKKPPDDWMFAGKAIVNRGSLGSPFVDGCRIVTPIKKFAIQGIAPNGDKNFSQHTELRSAQYAPSKLKIRVLFR
jgi:hypothetical protein